MKLEEWKQRLALMARSSLADLTPADAADLLELLKSLSTVQVVGSFNVEGHFAGVAVDLREENERLRAQVAALTTKTYCAYCGEASALDDDDAATKVGEHIRRCPKHPIAEYRHRCAELEAQVAALTAERDEARADAAESKEALENFIHTRLDEAIREEREDCAKVVENAHYVWDDPAGRAMATIASAIRARGGK